MAAGVRRITGVTGDLAMQAMAEGTELMARVEAAAAQSGPALKATLKTLNDDLNAADVSAATRMEVREKSKALEARQLDLDKKVRGRKFAFVLKTATVAPAAATAAAAVFRTGGTARSCMSITNA